MPCAILGSAALALLVGTTTNFPLDSLPRDDALAAIVWERSPELAQARARVVSARAELDRSRRLPNPQLELSWNTIPVGTTNPPNLPHPLSQVPNYAAFLSELIEIGKRGPRQRAARLASDAAWLDAAEALRQRILALLESVGRVAWAETRAAALSDLASDAAQLTQLQQARADRGDAAALDADRARLEEEKLRAGLAEERQRLAAALVECSGIVGAACEPFSDVERARAFLESTAVVPGGEASKLVEDRPDLRSLEAQARSAHAAESLARTRAIPDVTLRVGFTYDQFLVSGNQGKSVSIGASLPLPLFERGQTDQAQAAAAAFAAEQSRQLLLEQARRELTSLATQIERLRQRRASMQKEILPLARHVVESLTAALGTGGATLQDVLLARRTLGETLLDFVDLELAAVQAALQVRRVGGMGAVALPGEKAGPP